MEAPIAIKELTSAHFRHQTGSNLAIIGQNEEAAMAMFTTSILTLAAQHAPKTAKLYIIDLGSVDTPYAELLQSLTDVLPHSIEYGKRRQLPDFINTISHKLQKKLEQEDESLQDKEAVYLLIYGLQRARDLEQDDGFSGFSSILPSDGPDDSPKPPDPGKQFNKILREGPDLKIHTIVWCDTNTNLNRRLSRQTIREFEMRVVFQMSKDDSISLIDSPAASKLGQYRALFYNEEEGSIEKFRPFAVPNEQWLKQIKENWISLK